MSKNETKEVDVVLGLALHLLTDAENTGKVDKDGLSLFVSGALSTLRELYQLDNEDVVMEHLATSAARAKMALESAKEFFEGDADGTLMTKTSDFDFNRFLNEDASAVLDNVDGHPLEKLLMASLTNPFIERIVCKICDVDPAEYEEYIPEAQACWDNRSEKLLEFLVEKADEAWEELLNEAGIDPSKYRED